MRNKTLPQEIEWVEPENYLSINWEPKGERHPHNLMPTPYEEITRDEFDALLHCNSSGLAGINYRQVFLDDEEIIGVAYFYLFRKIAIAVVEYGVGWNTSRAKEKPGVVICRRDGWYFRLRYFQVGCAHPDMNVG